VSRQPRAYSPLGKVLEALRKMAGIPSLTELAQRTEGKVSYSYLMELVWGTKKKPSLDKLSALAQALGVSTERLIIQVEADQFAVELKTLMSLLPRGTWAELARMRTAERLDWTLSLIQRQYPEYDEERIAGILGVTVAHLRDLRRGRAILVEEYQRRLERWTGLDSRYWLLGADEVAGDLLSFILTAPDAKRRLEIIRESIKTQVPVEDLELAWETYKTLQMAKRKGGGQ
jgi:transcriptional regulator with XRE-family HTH domain